MSSKSEKARKITLAVVGGALAALMMFPSAAKPSLTVDDAARSLIYGKADATWTARAAEMAKSDAVAATNLRKLAESTNVDSLGRAKVLDALAQAGTPAAEAALFQALCSTSARNDGTYPLLMAGLDGGSPTHQGRATSSHKR